LELETETTKRCWEAVTILDLEIIKRYRDWEDLGMDLGLELDRIQRKILLLDLDTIKCHIMWHSYLNMQCQTETKNTNTSDE
jgi:hypothetical protein